MSGVKARLHHVLPALALDLARNARAKLSPAERRLAQQRDGNLDELALRVSPGGRVLAGPFATLRLPLRGSWGGLAARLAGTYEEEIAEHIEAAIARRPRLVVDAGAAEGYYAVGLATRLPAASVLAYDIDPYARTRCAETVRLNLVSNVTIRSSITARELDRRVEPGALVLCDVEGGEAELLNPLVTRALRLAHIIVELHEFIVPGVTETVLERFAPTHTIDVVTAVPRVGVRPQLAHLDERDAVWAIQEGRPGPPMQWAVMSPIAR